MTEFQGWMVILTLCMMLTKTDSKLIIATWYACMLLLYAIFLLEGKP